jgi:hypothetical protein
MGERRHEVDAGAAFDAIGQHIGQLIQRGIRDRRSELDDFSLAAHAARSSFMVTVETPSGWDFLDFIFG